MTLAPEGARIIILSAVMVLLAVVLSLLTVGGRGLWVPAVTVVLFLGVVWFFRDPARTPPEGEGLVLAPADGRIISVGDAVGSPLDPPGQRVSIFMSPLDVHVNRAPAAGNVVGVEYRRGGFKPAHKPSAPRENESNRITLDTGRGELAFVQVAGFLARRIVCHLRTGDRVQSGDRIGMIKFGSRVDLYLPDEVAVRIHLGDRVTAGETIIGVFRDAQA